jgi:hypothetical protein
MMMPRILQVLVILGATWAIAVSTWVGVRQLNLLAIWRNEIPTSVAIDMMNRNAIFFLTGMVFLGIVSILSTFHWHKSHSLYSPVLWLIASAIYAYSIYYTRFSMGPLLIPTAFLIGFSGCFAIAMSLAPNQT